MGNRETSTAVWKLPDLAWDQIHPAVSEMNPPKSVGC